MDRDAMINDFIRLKETPAAPVERWQMVPAIRRSVSAKNLTSRSALEEPAQPLQQIQMNIPNSEIPKTPRTPRLVMQGKTPKSERGRSKSVGSRSTTTTPGLHKTPLQSGITPGKNGQTPSGCRFIPNMSTTDMEYSSFLLRQKDRKPPQDANENEGDDEKDSHYKQALISAISASRGHQQSGVLSFKSTTPSVSNSFMESGASCRASATKSTRHYPSAPEKILDAPTLTDDYYLNNLDWGKGNLVAIGLGNGVYLWNANNGTSHQLMELKDDHYVSSVAWSGTGRFLAIGDSNACIQLWDVEKDKKIRTMRGHSDRVGVLAWSKHTLASASRDGVILYNDVRKPEHVVARSCYHKMEVCGMQWSPDGSKLASGGNDNLVCVWDTTSPMEPLHILQGHKAAVKAVVWCPWQPNILVTGGGSNDKTIRFWNSFTGQCTDKVDAKSQVSALRFNKHHKLLISAHGHPKNHMVIWQYPSMSKVGTLPGHSDRILHMVLSPGKSRVASAGSDETLKIWKCFERVLLDRSERSQCEISALLHSLN